MWPFNHKRIVNLTTRYDKELMRLWFEKKMVDRLLNEQKLDMMTGNTVTFDRLLPKEKETETPMLLPKDILSELEVLKEERMNEHLKSIGISGDQVNDQAAVLRALQQAQGMFNQGLGQGQQGSDQLRNQQLAQNMFASSMMIMPPRNNW